MVHVTIQIALSLLTANGDIIEPVDSIGYLGVYFVSGRLFKCNWDHAKSSYYGSFNAIFGRIGRFASVETVMYLMKANVYLSSFMALKHFLLIQVTLKLFIMLSLQHLWKYSIQNQLMLFVTVKWRLNSAVYMSKS